MVGMLVMYKTVTLWNSRTQATIAGGDAQIAGTLAIYALERDLKLAGMGFSQAAGDMGCMVQGKDNTTGQLISFPLLPIEIIDGTAAACAGRNPCPVWKFADRAACGRSTSRRQQTQKTMTNTRNGFQPGDVAIVTDGVGGLPSASKCALVEITSNTTPGGFFLDHAAGSYSSYYASAVVPSRYNDVSADTLVGTPFTAGNMYSLGPNPRRNVWSIRCDSGSPVGDMLQIERYACIAASGSS